MEIVNLLFLWITGVYCLMILAFIIGSLRLSEQKQSSLPDLIEFSVIIPFRNEETHLPKLLTSLKNLQYPKILYEVILVDDESSDDSVHMIHRELKDSKINYKVLTSHRTSKSPKKDALQLGITSSEFHYIITTDADCILPTNWLRSYNTKLHQGLSDFVAGPIDLISNISFLQGFQLLENCSLQTATQGGFGLGFPFLANGANICFSKKSFMDVNGYQGNNQIASGDDIFLLEKMLLHQKKVSYLKSDQAKVKTYAEKSWPAMIQQRIRWGSKSKNYQLKRAKIVGAMIIIMNLSLVLSGVIAFAGYSNKSSFLCVLSAKLVVDFASMMLQMKGNDFKVIGWYPLASLVYPFLCLWIVFKGFAGTYQWKERSFHS